MLRSEPAGSDSDVFGVERRPGEVKPMSDSPLCEIPQPGTRSGKTKLEKVANGGREIMTAGNARTAINDEILTISEVAKLLAGPCVQQRSGEGCRRLPSAGNHDGKAEACPTQHVGSVGTG